MSGRGKVAVALPLLVYCLSPRSRAPFWKSSRAPSTIVRALVQWKRARGGW